MSDTRELDPLLDTAKEPAKLWRNWWAARKGAEHKPSRVTCTRCGAVTMYPVGECWGACCRVFPSQDQAETAAKAVRLRPHAPRWVGAYPDGERPAFW